MASGPDGTLYVSWRKIYPSPHQTEMREVVVASSHDHGASWSAPVRVHADDWHVDYCPDAGPSIKVGPNGVVHVAWWTGKPGAAGVRYTQSRDGARTFTEPVELRVAAASRASHVQLALGSGADSSLIAAVWDDGTRQTPQIILRESRDGGRTFGPVTELSVPGNVAGYPVIGLRGDSVRVAWQERSTAAATHDSATHAAHSMNMGGASMYIAPVGSLNVTMRAGVL